MSATPGPLTQAWLRLLFWHARHAPIVPRLLRPLCIGFAWVFGEPTRRVLCLNARRFHGDACSPRLQRRFGLAVLGNFYDAVVDLGRTHGPAPGASRRLESLVGEQAYLAARARRRGAILATAHLGSFETAMSLLRERESRIHVVFKRDEVPLFEDLRRACHERLGVIEAPIDEGLATWARLREALLADAVVLLQADRVLPGQRGAVVPFLQGSICVPTGPAKLSRLTGAPIIPVFAVRGRRGTRIELCEPLWPDDHPPPRRASAASDPLTLALTRQVERVVSRHPEQWLCLQPVFIEDQLHPCGEPAAT